MALKTRTIAENCRERKSWGNYEWIGVISCSRTTKPRFRVRISRYDWGCGAGYVGASGSIYYNAGWREIVTEPVEFEGMVPTVEEREPIRERILEQLYDICLRTD